MSNLKIQRIEAPKLNVADYGPNISTQFNNIDINFQALANSDFFTGARGKGLKLIEVEPTSSNTFKFREDLEFHDESILEGSAGTALKNSIIDAFKKYNKSNTTWYVGKKYVLYIDNNKKVHNIYPIIYTSETVGVDGNTSQDNSYLDFEYVNKVLTLTKSKGYPSLYYDSDEKKYCWLINGAKTGIVAQGKDGLDGQPGSGYDFDVLKVETEPLTNDGFYKISEVYWPKYFKWQKFDLDISSKDGKLNAGGSGYTATDVEWLSGGRDQWINSYGSKTFIVPRTIIEYVEVDPGTGTHKKVGEGEYVPVSGGEPGNYIQKPVSVLHLCKLIKESALNIKQGFDKVDVDPVKPDTGGIIVDDNKELIDPKTDTVVEEATTNNSEPVLMTAAITPNQTGPIIATDKTTIGSMAPVFSTVVSEATKREFAEAYDNNKKFVDEISTGKVTTIQYVTDEHKSVEVNLEGPLGSQIKASTAQYAVYVYGVYLTKDNMHSLTSTISSGSTTGVSLAFDDINWASSNNSTLRCLYLKDCKKDADAIPNSGILIYNGTQDADTSGTLNMRYVDNVTGYRFGSNNRPDPDAGDDKYNSLTLDLGTNGALKTGCLDVKDKLSVKDEKDTNGNIQTLVDIKGLTTIDGDLVVKTEENSVNVTINGSTTTNNLTVTNDLTIEKDLKVAENLKVTKDLTVDGNLTVGTEGSPVDVTINGSKTTINGDLKVAEDLKVTKDLAVDGNLTVGTEENPTKVNINGSITTDNITLSKATKSFVGMDRFKNIYSKSPNAVNFKNPSVNLSTDIQQHKDDMYEIHVPAILLGIIKTVYKDKSIKQIKNCVNTTWVSNDFEQDYVNTDWIGNDFELKIRYIKNDGVNHLYYHITGYIGYTINDSYGNYIDYKRLNLDTLVRTKVNTTKEDEVIIHKDLSLKIYNGSSGYDENADKHALPYMYLRNGVDTFIDDLKLVRGMVNITSVDGPYFVNTCEKIPSDEASGYLYCDVRSSWYTTVYYSES